MIIHPHDMSQTLRVCLRTLPTHIQLNEKQLKVLEKLLNGQSYKSIAADMMISMAAVRQYAHRSYKKLEVANRLEAVLAYGMRG
ncbi:MAG: LuxR C-terminal-related transcriptional regulator [Saprospiraceae bacterium]